MSKEKKVNFIRSKLSRIRILVVFVGRNLILIQIGVKPSRNRTLAPQTKQITVNSSGNSTIYKALKGKTGKTFFLCSELEAIL